MAKFERGLGRGFNARGLNALIDTEVEEVNNLPNVNTGVTEIDIMHIEPNKDQPRKEFNKDSIDELASSIKQVGIIQPLIVTKKGDFYEIVAGERRYRAARLAGLEKIPVIVREYSELEALQTALIENVQREDLNPIEEALTYKRFNEEFSLSQEEIAEKVGKSRPAVANSMRLLKLDTRVIDYIRSGRLSAGHGKALLSIDNFDDQLDLAQKCMENSYSVRQAEDMARRIVNGSKQKTDKEPVENIYHYVEKELSDMIGAKVNIKRKGKSRKLEIEFYSDEEIEGFISLIKKSFE